MFYKKNFLLYNLYIYFFPSCNILLKLKLNKRVDEKKKKNKNEFVFNIRYYSDSFGISLYINSNLLIDCLLMEKEDIFCYKNKKS